MSKAVSLPFATVEEFVEWSEGDHVIKKVLIANNGIGAVKAIRSIRRWAYDTFGNEKIIQFVVMATPDDMKANAEFIRMADIVVDVPGGSNNNNYANVNLICEIAERYQVDAVIPLWGHASENPSLPRSLLKCSRKIVFVGPPEIPMQALGDKIGSTIIAQSAGVPTIAWNGDSIIVDYAKEGISAEVYDKANVKTVEEAMECCLRIGFPVMIKASEGGGGKGIRKVLAAEEVESSFRQVQGEVPGSPIFIMKLAPQSRHLEVQLLGDAHGNVIAFGGRDCSVQRRHQKIIEEGPPIAADPSVFRKMENSAIALAKTVGYRSTGTVEFLFVEETQEFAFLELNPRLQVEHPVTENIFEVNLPACQLMVAMGIRLHRISEVRRVYGRNPLGKDTIDFDYSEKVPLKKHCIAVRITAENPDVGFQPTSGKITELQFRSSIDVWGYFSVNSSGLIHEFADSQFGHLFAQGKDRESARRAMIIALKELEIRGVLRTTVEYVIRLMQTEDYINNRIDTTWLDHRIANHSAHELEYRSQRPHPVLIAICGAAVTGFRNFEDRRTNFMEKLRVGHIPAKDSIMQAETVDLIFENIKYKLHCKMSGHKSINISCRGDSVTVVIRQLSDGGYLMDVNGKSLVVYSQTTGGHFRIIVNRQTFIFTPEYDPTRLVSNVAGKLARLLVQDGEHVKAGDSFAEVEVMKMYMTLKAKESGVVRFKLSEGATLSPGDLIATMVLDDADRIVTAEEFTGKLSSFIESDIVFNESYFLEKLPHHKRKLALAEIDKVLDGYPLTDSEIEAALEDCISTLHDRLLPVYEIQEALSVLRGRIDNDLFNRITELNEEYNRSISNSSILFPANKILSAIWENAQNLSTTKRISFLNQINPVWEIAEANLYIAEARILDMLLKFLEKYLSVENQFDNMSFADAINKLRKLHVDQLENLWKLCTSHSNIVAKNQLVLKIIDIIATIPPYIVNQRPKYPSGIILRHELNVRNVKVRLHDLTKLRSPIYSHINFAANLVLMHQSILTVEQRKVRLHETLVQALSTGDKIGQGERFIHMKKFMDSHISIRDLVTEAMLQDREYQIAFMELYLYRSYQKTHHLKNFSCGVSLTDDASDPTPWIRFDFMNRTYDLTNRSFFEAPRERTASSEESSISDEIRFMTRLGVFAALMTAQDIFTHFVHIYSKIPRGSGVTRLNEPVNAIHILILHNSFSKEDDASKFFADYFSAQREELVSRGIRRVTVLIARPDDNEVQRKVWSQSRNFPYLFTFRAKSDYGEDRLCRNVEAPHAFYLDLPRLANFNIRLEDGLQTPSGNVSLYHATPIGSKGAIRYFARLVSFTAEIGSPESEALFVEALDILTLVHGRGATGNEVRNSKNHPSQNHIFLNIIIPDIITDPISYEDGLKALCAKYSEKLGKLLVSNVEIKLTCKLAADGEPMHFRFNASNPTGYVLKIDSYTEEMEDGVVVFRSMGHKSGEWNGCPVSTPYPVTTKFELKRIDAVAASDTLYVYDWPSLFERAVEDYWNNYIRERPKLKKKGAAAPFGIFSCQELVLCKGGDPEKPLQKGWTAQDAHAAELVPVDREPGLNDTGMVAWLLTIVLPDVQQQQRQIVLIANDITFNAGSFGTTEDALFLKASQYARKRGLPRLYLAANSGARIGMAQSLKDKFEVCWTDPSDPAKGYKYIYMSEENYMNYLNKVEGNISSLPFECQPRVGPNGETRYVITDIIGEETDLGVENLMGSGMIAGETSRAYNDIFTLTMVVGRSVGIGAYLVRLGQRTIQNNKMSPIILTGFQALNKLMGRDIYTTNDQLGGPMIMFPNGVSHLLADTHMDCVQKALIWLSYVPAVKFGSLPIYDIAEIDQVHRNVTIVPKKNIAYDPRHLITGVISNTDDGTMGTWLSGFCDRGSFVEFLEGWAKTVVVGRARLGGIPIGLILTENRTVEAYIPADPADATSQEKMVQQAGGVWFPDSAYKTAQALRDFNQEGLPCFVFANWRGFSGGQRDMFDEVLKFGSMIVDAFVAYKQPLFVYIPPHAELRGGAWVVVDSTINSDVMEFYAAEDARGGVLEATGAASIKYRDAEIRATAHRLDQTLIRLNEELKAIGSDASRNSERDEIQRQIRHREQNIIGVYRQIAIHFADLHDTPGRMKAKGVIRQQVAWAQSRAFFYWRLRRRLAEFEYGRQLQDLSQGKKTLTDCVDILKTWFLEEGGSQETWQQDEQFATWIESHKELLSLKVELVKKCATIETFVNLLNQFHHHAASASQQDDSLTASITGQELLESVLHNLNPEVKATLSNLLNQK